MKVLSLKKRPCQKNKSMKPFVVETVFFMKHKTLFLPRPARTVLQPGKSFGQRRRAGNSRTSIVFYVIQRVAGHLAVGKNEECAAHAITSIFTVVFAG
ncbi:MAG: hypothetical protein AB7E77_08565 [Desulfobulbus sp.]